MNDGRSTSSISYQNLTLGCGGGKEGKVLEPFWRADKFLLKKSLKRTPKIEETKNGNYLFQLMLLLLATNYKERRSNLMTTSSK